MGLACSFQGLGQFLQAIIYDPILRIVGGLGKPVFGVSAVAFTFLLVASVIVSLAKKERSTV